MCWALHIYHYGNLLNGLWLASVYYYWIYWLCILLLLTLFVLWEGNRAIMKSLPDFIEVGKECGLKGEELLAFARRELEVYD